MRKTFPAHKTALHRVKPAKTPILTDEFELRVTQRAGALMREIRSDRSRDAYRRPTCGRLGRRVSLSDEVSASMRAAG
jgi:hypothetical protein